ncbi:MAG TPA: CHAT domain-containing protein [Bryobacteraceae bacterium]|jgi:CHAT domain-containing protein/pimeloyl-ACP methyl ester carboxylesterase
MPEENIVLLVPGIATSRIPDPELRKFLEIRPIAAHDIVTPRRGAPEIISRVEGPPDSIVRVEYESGLFEYLRLDQFRDQLGVSRAEGPARVPTALDRGAIPGRGATEWTLKALHVFGINPVDAAAEKSADLIVKHFDEKLDTGLFRLAADGAFKEKIARPLAADPRPQLIFIHGTASSTQGSFSGFWRDGKTKQATREWHNLLKVYEDRIFALEHATLSVSPAHNALDLIALLPPKANLHVITHSRGGLVGELLGFGALSADDRKAFAGRLDAALLERLASELKRKKLTVEKFVRTACPAAGTILASGRLDTYLNILLNVIGLIPGLSENPFYEVFKATAIELIKLRADPDKIPGIEAQMPESPFIHLLNTRGRSSEADLGVIAGSFAGAGVWSTLGSYALRAYYWEDNDFVVNTKSMAAGMDRKRKVWEFRDQGSTVNHFSYFKNERTRAKVLEWLTAAAGAPVPEFKPVRALRTISRPRAPKSPVAVIVPDVFGTHLQWADGTKIWLNYAELGKGAFHDLAEKSAEPAEALDVYQGLLNALSADYQTSLFAYDWSQSIASNAEKLEKWLPAKSGPTHFIGHGMGALVVREFARAHPERWDELTKDGGKLLMLGAPNGGSWNIARLLAGRSRLVRMLALLGRRKNEEIAAVFRTFPGLIDLLPEEMLTPAAWKRERMQSPALELLKAGREWRAQIREARIPSGRILRVAGCAPATPSGLNDYSPEGDGDIVYSLGIDSNIGTWYNLNAAHGDLIANPAPLMQLLASGATTAYDSKFQPPMRPPMDRQKLLDREMAVFFPSETDLVNAALVRSETATVAAQPSLKVKVTHGHLREARHPVVVGHYAGDGIVSAEEALDRQLGGRLSTRFHMDIYPGPKGTVEVIRATECNPSGAIVIGLGEVGEITANTVRQGVLEGCLQYALTSLENDSADDESTRSAAVSCLLIGASGGRAISVADSVTAIVRGAVEANRVLRRHSSGQVRVDEIEFIEIYEDAAIEAATAAGALPEALKNALEPGESVEFDGRMRALSSGLSRRTVNQYATGWWRRIQIEGGEAKPEEPAQKLSFDNLTDRARAENTDTETQTSLVNGLLEAATSQTSYDSATTSALFELLIPNSLKDQSAEEANLLLVVDPAASRYPWELMAERSREKISPLAVRMGIVRQLKTKRFRAGPRGARDHNALIVGDPTAFDKQSALPELKGAQEEARVVSDLLTRRRYTAHSLICADSADVVRALFAHEYRILHLAGHGDYNAKDPARSGMVLRWSDDPAGRAFLTAMEVEQIRQVPDLVFINCCHLGKIDQPLGFPAHRFAASISEKLIEIGVKAVIAAGWAVDDAAAVTFARSFYRWMLAGGKFGEAVKRAREDAFALGDNNTWGAYQCYGNPDFMLTPREDLDVATARRFYARRECIEELKNIAAESQGADDKKLPGLQRRVLDVERALGTYWRDGESLFELAEALKCMKDFEHAIDIYREAIEQENAFAPVRAIEQLANVMDRYASGCFKEDAKRALELWEDAERRLEGLNELLGESNERLSMLGGMYKRRAGQGGVKKTQLLRKALDCYTRAYEHSRNKLKTLDPYPGLNAIALAWLAGRRVSFEDECMAEAKSRKDAANFWDRVYNPDALLLDLLKNGRVSEKEVIRAYKTAFQHATPSQSKSATGQIEYLKAQTAIPEAASRLERILAAIV